MFSLKFRPILWRIRDKNSDCALFSKLDVVSSLQLRLERFWCRWKAKKKIYKSLSDVKFSNSTSNIVKIEVEVPGQKLWLFMNGFRLRDHHFFMSYWNGFIQKPFSSYLIRLQLLEGTFHQRKSISSSCYPWKWMYMTRHVL